MEQSVKCLFTYRSCAACGLPIPWLALACFSMPRLALQDPYNIASGDETCGGELTRSSHSLGSRGIAEEEGGFNRSRCTSTEYSTNILSLIRSKGQKITAEAAEGIVTGGEAFWDRLEIRTAPFT